MPSQVIHKELAELETYCNQSMACDECARQSIKCEHSKPTLLDRIKELKQKRTIKPLSVIFSMYLLLTVSATCILMPYIVQVLKVFGSPINANTVTVILSGVGVLAAIFQISVIKKMGRRPLYFISSVSCLLCTFGLSKFELLILLKQSY